jgi:hypothetical protein
MGVNDEYSRDAYDYELAYNSDNSDEFEPDPLHPEDYQDWYSEQLLDAWMTIREYTEQNYIQISVTFNDFVHFVMYHQDFYTEEPPTDIVVRLWTAIKNIQVIRENITIENFTAWADFNILSN